MLDPAATFFAFFLIRACDGERMFLFESRAGSEGDVIAGDCL